MPSLNESIYSTFTKIFTNPIYQNVKKNTEWKRKYLFYGHSTVSKVEFDNYLSILFIMFINGAKGSAENNWSKDPSYRHKFITSIGMDYKQWQEVNRCINFGESSSQQDFDDDIQLHGDNIQLESDSEPEPDNEYAMTEEEIIEKNLKRERKEYEILEKNNKVKQMRESVEKVQSFLKILQDQFQKIYYQYQDIFCGSNLVIDEQLIKFFGRIFFSQFNPNKPAKRGILIRTCVDCLTNFVLSMDLYAGSLTKGATDVVSIVNRLLSFKIPNYPYKLFCDNWYSTLSLVDKVIKDNMQYVGTVQVSRLASVFTPKQLKYKEVDYRRIIFKDSFINMLQWKCQKDKVVSMLFSDIQNENKPDHTVKYESFRHILQDQPFIVRHYNDNYHGVDNVDQLMSQIRYPYKCCRWTSRMWIYSIQTVIINSFQLFKRLHREHAQISIRDYIIGLVQQIQENRIKYEIRYQFYFNKKQINQPRQPKCKQQIQITSCF
ncbi:Transposase_IS4 [Hexamita inflata]|uniref:Transposase_IS4 n=1 Tax=Hexamita inflata TaxID=28002 RepID=A0ABP1KQ19_9EUKA